MQCGAQTETIQATQHILYTHFLNAIILSIGLFLFYVIFLLLLLYYIRVIVNEYIEHYLFMFMFFFSSFVSLASSFSSVVYYYYLANNNNNKKQINKQLYMHKISTYMYDVYIHNNSIIITSSGYMEPQYGFFYT